MGYKFIYKTELYAVAIIFLTLASISAKPKHEINKSKSKPCFTKDCITTAATIIKNMDPSIDPCSDFYNYVCGRFSERVLVNDHEIFVTTQSLIYNQYLAEIRSLLDSPKMFHEPDAVWKAKDFFFACMNDSYSEDDSALRYIEESLGGFPVLMGDMWDPSNFNWLDMAIYLHRNGFQRFGFFDFGQNTYQTETEKGEKYQFIVGAGRSSMPDMFPKIFTLRRYSEAYPNITRVIANLLRGFSPKDEQNHTEEIKKLVQFAIAIEDGPDGESIVLPLTELARLTRGIDWQKSLTRVFNRKVGNTTALLVNDFQRLKRIIKLASITDKRIVANYIILNLLFSLYQQQELTQYLAIKISMTLAKETGAKLESPSSQVTTCIEHAGYLSGVVETMYFKKYLEGSDMQYNVLKMENVIRDQFLKSIEHSYKESPAWGDVVQLMRANSSIVVDIGATESILDDLNLDRLYSELSSHRSDHFVNVLARKRFQQMKMNKQYPTLEDANLSLKLIRKLRSPFVTYFGNVKKGITYIGIPPILLRGITFSQHRDSSLNFGTLGMKIMEGLLLYLSKNLAFTSNPREIIEEFLEMKRCMAKEFDVNNSFYPEAKLAIKSNVDKSALSTLMTDELIAVRNVYSAHQKWILQHTSNLLLPSISANKDQLFWIAYATLHCDVYDEEALMNSDDAPGFPQRIKVLNVVRNAPEFSKAFQCAAGASMNSEHRCKLIYESK